MDVEQIIKTIAAIGRQHPKNLMARHFDGNYFVSLDTNRRQRLLEIINSGIENPQSEMGAYAKRHNDYEIFAPLLDPMVRDFHNIAADSTIEQKHDWRFQQVPGNLADLDVRLKKVSMRVRVARNVASFPLPGAMDKNQRCEFEELAVLAFQELARRPDFGGRYLSLTPGSHYQMDEFENIRRIRAHQMFKDMSVDKYLFAAGISADWPYGRGLYISRNEDFLVWVGEEDHLRIIAMHLGGDLGTLFDRLHFGLQILQDVLPPFANSPTYGYVTSCPTNLGAGMRASLHLKLPKLTSNGQDLAELKQIAETLGLAVRGVGGEHSAAGSNGLVDISPAVRLGVTEVEIMARLYQGVKKLWKLEHA